MNEIIKNSEDFGEKIHRVGNTVAWLDEALNNDLIPHLKKAINESDMHKKNTILLSVLTYWHGVQDGNRFNRPYPYDENNPMLDDDGGSRVMYLLE